MQHIHKLPFILGCLAAMVVGIVSYTANNNNQTIFLHMAVTMTIFFIIGVYIRNTILSIQDEVAEKEKERAINEELLKKQEQEQQNISADAAKHQQAHQGQLVDLVAEDKLEEFEPMTVSRVISTKVKE